MSRHKSLAGAMSALMAYRNRPEGEPVPVQTNWSVVAANDNEPEVIAEMGHERIRLVTPSVSEIMRQVGTGDVERNKDGQIVRIGKLRFSDGTQVERGHKYGPGGDVVATELRMPTGAMLGCQDRQHTAIGGAGDPAEATASNNYFVDMFGTSRFQRKPARKKDKRNGRGCTRTEARAVLAEAYANTPVLPPITKYPPGLPGAGNRISDSFLGMKKAPKGESGSMGWQDICTSMVDREIWAHAIAELSEKDRTTLDAVAHGRAQTLRDVAGKVMSKRGAEYRGKRMLKAANDNLESILKKIA